MRWQQLFDKFFKKESTVKNKKKRDWYSQLTENQAKE
jgi:hypothetical protein